MHFICHLTEWTSIEVTRGRYKGNISKSRQVIAVDNWNWVIGIQKKENVDPIGESFYPSLRIFLPNLFTLESINFNECLQRLLSTLKGLTGINYPLPPDKLDTNTLGKYGKILDDVYGTSFIREYPPQTVKRLFKTEDKEVLV